MALRDKVYQLWGTYASIPSLETVSNVADYAAFFAFAVLLLSIGGVGIALGVLGPSWSLAISAASILVGEALVAGAFLGLSVLLDRANSYAAYLRAKQKYKEAVEDQPDPPKEVDVTPETNPVKQAEQAEQAEQTEQTGQAQSRTLPNRG